MGKLRLHTVAFIDLVDLKYPGVANLSSIYPKCNCRLVMCQQIYGDYMRLVVYMQIFLLKGVLVNGNEWQI